MDSGMLSPVPRNDKWSSTPVSGLIKAVRNWVAESIAEGVFGYPIPDRLTCLR